MGIQAQGWFAQSGGGPLKKDSLQVPDPGAGEVVLAVEACGLCHTDLGFASAKVAPKHALPLVLGHEMVGRILEAGPGAESWKGKNVIVPAVLPCGDCAFCRAGRGNACPRQKMPGNDIHGGFASHTLLPAASLVAVDSSFSGAKFRALGVVADAVSTAYQAVKRSGVGKGDVAVVIGTGGVGAFAVQIARALGAHVLAADVRQDRLELMTKGGAEATFLVEGEDVKKLRQAIGDLGKKHSVPSFRQFVFECSGNAKAQSLAFGALPHAGTLAFVGYTIDKVQVRLSNLMALDATAFGTWGCPPGLYPEVLAMIQSGAITLDSFIEEAPMHKINELLDAMAEHKLDKRMVLVPDFGSST